MAYLWIKAFHLIFVVAFMAGMMIYPRYLVHQAGAAPGDPLFQAMQSAGGKLRKIILGPSIVLVWILGISMLVMNPSLLSSGWMHIKLLLVVVLTGLHGMFVGLGKKVNSGETVSPRILKIMNEVPFVLFAVVVIMVIVRPF
jgi:putative membrane protein